MTELIAAPQPLALASFHRRLGAEMAVRTDGVGVPLRYGPVVEELAALGRGAAFADRSFGDLIELSGADRQRFLHGLVTCDVKGLAPGSGSYGYFSTGQGRILTDFGLLALEDRLRLELPAGRGGEIVAHLSKYLLADRVEIRRLDEAVKIALLGAGIPERFPELAVLPADGWAHRRIEIRGLDVLAVREPRLGVPAVALWLSPSDALALVEEFLASGVAPVGFEALEVLRVEAGLPRFGLDFGPDHFPQETGQETAAVSYTKGCYLGQEVIARIHYRGGVQRILRGLRFAGEVPAHGGELALDGRSVGAVGSVVASPRFGAIGLAIVHKRAAEPGTRLAYSGGEAEVAALPFERSEGS